MADLDNTELTFLQDLPAHASPKGSDLLLVNTDGMDKSLTLSKLEEFASASTVKKVNNKSPDNNGNIQLSAGDVGALSTTGGSINGNLTVNNAIQVGAVGSAVLNIGDNDSGLRSSVDGQVDLWANSKVVGNWNGTAFSFSGQIIPTNYTNFDARFQAKGNYTPAGQAYTKAESDARYGVINGIRRGGQQIRNSTDAWFGNWESPAGCVVTGIQMDGKSDGRKLGVYFRQMQYLNKQTGAWVNIGG